MCVLNTNIYLMIYANIQFSKCWVWDVLLRVFKLQYDLYINTVNMYDHVQRGVIYRTWITMALSHPRNVSNKKKQIPSSFHYGRSVTHRNRIITVKEILLLL